MKLRGGLRPSAGGRTPEREAGRPPRTTPEPTIALRRILWACDMSTGSVEALRWVLPLAGAYGSEITALHVIPTTVPARGGPLALASPALLRPNLRHEAVAAHDRFAGVAIAASIPTRVVLREGKAVTHILHLADEMAAELIVQGTRGLGAIERAMIGSVAEAVIGRARCPVLTIPLEAHVPWGGTQAGPIVCATDFSAPAMRATAHALSLARRGGAELVLVHVVDTHADDAWADEAERRLAHAAAATGLGTLVRTALLHGDPSEQILRIAGERKPSVVVAGTRGARALGSIVFGSTARRVVRDAPCAVLTVRAG